MMAKAKQPVIEMDFISSFSEHSQGSEREGGADAATAETSEAARKHDEYVARCTELACRAQSLSDEIAVERYSESRLDESRRNLDWSVATDRRDHFKFVMPPATALMFLDAARPDLVGVVETGGITVKGGRTSLHLEKPEDIDKAVELIKKLSEPKPEKGGGKKKKASAKNEAKAAKPKKRVKKR
jgi:hypothetical protein